jgi:hypothetical protein
VTTTAVVLTSLLAYRLLQDHLLAAQVVWQLGFAAAVTLALYFFRRPEIAYFYTLLPLLAAVILGWPASLLSEGLVTLLASSACST